MVRKRGRLVGRLEGREHRSSYSRWEPIDVQHAVEVVALVQEAPGQQARSMDNLRVTEEIQARHCDL